jgi:hypothetical protein
MTKQSVILELRRRNHSAEWLADQLQMSCRKLDRNLKAITEPLANCIQRVFDFEDLQVRDLPQPLTIYLTRQQFEDLARASAHIQEPIPSLTVRILTESIAPLIAKLDAPPP